jgi:hypothetical protein
MMHMRSVNELPLRTLAASFAILVAASLVPSCAVTNAVEDLVNAGKDCSTACTALSKCGLIQTSDCGAYCAGLESSAVSTGCEQQFANQNACGAAHTECTATSAETCAPETMALTECIKTYCEGNPGANGCPLATDAGTDAS